MQVVNWDKDATDGKQQKEENFAPRKRVAVKNHDRKIPVKENPERERLKNHNRLGPCQ